MEVAKGRKPNDTNTDAATRMLWVHLLQRVNVKAANMLPLVTYNEGKQSSHVLRIEDSFGLHQL